MSVSASVQHLASGLGTTIGGLIVEGGALRCRHAPAISVGVDAGILKGPLPHSPKRRAEGPKLDETKRWLAVHHGEQTA
jgi:hypothetical protein